MPFEVRHDLGDFVHVMIWNAHYRSVFNVATEAQSPTRKEVEKLVRELADYGEPDDDALELLHQVWPGREREVAKLILERAFAEGGGR